MHKSCDSSLASKAYAKSEMDLSESESGQETVVMDTKGQLVGFWCLR